MSVAALAVYLTISLNSVNSALYQSTNKQLMFVAKYNSALINSRLKELEQIAQSSAAEFEMEKSLTENNIKRHLEVNLNQDTLVYGTALAFVPYGFSKEKRIYSPYMYKSPEGIKYIDIAEESYDYTLPQWEWYNRPIANNAPIWTEPYFDEGAGNIVMCTYSVPVYKAGKLWAIVTVDIALEPLNKLLDATGYKNSGFIVLSSNGKFVYHSMEERILGDIRDTYGNSIVDTDTHEAGKRMMLGESGRQKLRTKNGSGDYYLYFSRIPTAHWSFGMYVLEDEAFGQLSGRLWNIIIVSLTGLTALIVVMLFTLRQTNRKVG